MTKNKLCTSYGLGKKHEALKGNLWRFQWPYIFVIWQYKHYFCPLVTKSTLKCVFFHFCLCSLTALIVLSPSHSNKHWQKALYLCFPGIKQNSSIFIKIILAVFKYQKGKKKCLYTVKNKNSYFAYNSRMSWDIAKIQTVLSLSNSKL